MQCKMNLFHISVANLGFLHGMRMARWIKTNQIKTQPRYKALRDT